MKTSKTPKLKNPTPVLVPTKKLSREISVVAFKYPIFLGNRTFTKVDTSTFSDLWDIQLDDGFVKIVTNSNPQSPTLVPIENISYLMVVEITE